MAASDNSTPEPANDRELLYAVEAGDASAFEALVERHGRYLHGIAFAMSGNAADAEDLVQETFVAALNARFRGESSVRTWLVKVLVRRAGMLRRWRWTRRRHVPLEDAKSEATAEAGGAVARLDLTTMLQSLSEDHRAVIVLRELEQLSYGEIAATLGVPRGTVESRLHRAREELRKKFKGYLQGP